MTVPPAPRLILGKDHRSALAAAAKAAYPNEFCALLIGVGASVGVGKSEPPAWRITRVEMAANVDPRPDRGFELDPTVLVRVLRQLREAERAGQGGGERLLGHAHSHPDAEARPSARDVALSFKSDQFWLIVPVDAGRPGEPSAFQATTEASGGRGFRPVELARAEDELEQTMAGAGQETP